MRHPIAPMPLTEAKKTSGTASKEDGMSIYTLGIWQVKPGYEDRFVHAWHELADRMKEDFPAETVTLHRDLDESSTFISFGPWTSVEEIDRVRASATFQEGVAKIRPFLADFTTHTMEIVGGVE
jgi:quinol monooxygenase YgiN